MNTQRTAGTVALIAGAGLLILAIVSSVGGFIAGAQGWSGVVGTPGTVSVPWMMGGGFGPAMMGGGHMGPGMMGGGHMGYGGTSSGTTAPIAGAPTATVTTSEFAFSPSTITLASREADLTLVNKGTVVHDLTVPALGVRVVAAAGQTTTVGLRDLPTGTYAGYCSVPGHAEAGMRITVVVQ